MNNTIMLELLLNINLSKLTAHPSNKTNTSGAQEVNIPWIEQNISCHSFSYKLFLFHLIFLYFFCCKYITPKINFKYFLLTGDPGCP